MTTNPGAGKPEQVIKDLITDACNQYRYYLDYPILHRDEEVDEMLNISNSETSKNILLIGDVGVGLQTIIKKYAVDVYKENRKFVLDINPDDLKSIPSNPAQIIETLHDMCGALNSTNRYVVCIHNIAKYLNFSTYAAFGFEIINQVLRSRIPVVFTGTEKDLETIESNHRWIIQTGINIVKVREMPAKESTDVLKGFVNRTLLKNPNIVKIDDSFIPQIIASADKYIKRDKFPGKANRLADRVISCIIRKTLNNDEQGDTLYDDMIKKCHRINDLTSMDYEQADKLLRECGQMDNKLWDHRIKNQKNISITKEGISDALAEILGIPNHSLDAASIEELKSIEPKIKEKIKGQDQVISEIVHSVKRAKFGLKKHGRTVGNFFFIGPTGVGKTETAKQVAKVLYNSENKLLRFDMSEYQTDIDVSKLIGSAPGYVGFKETGVLTQGLQRQPDSIVLFDEIEKASPKIYNLLLQLLDEGHLTSGDGKKVDARQCMIIFTSNIGVKLAKSQRPPVGFRTDDPTTNQNQVARSVIEKALKDRFSPEFLNRIDSICYFNELSKETLADIVDNEIDEVNTNIFAVTGKKLVISKKAKNYIVDKTMKERNGARPIIRIIEQEIESKISDMILDDKLPKRAKNIKVDMVDDCLTIV